MTTAFTPAAAVRKPTGHPYFSNIRFLNGKLGGLNGEDENFNEQIAMQAYSLRAAAETFLIFEMRRQYLCGSPGESDRYHWRG